MGFKVLRNVSEAELKLMFARLVIKVQEEPEMFTDINEGVNSFFDGEDKRRELLVEK
jgi:hypothetical protein